MDPLFHVLAKPTGARCNLDCQYCFYLEKEALFPGSRFQMSDATADAYVDQIFQVFAQEAVVPLAWQGGEPTLMGLDFFRRLTERARTKLKPGQRLEQSLQTNGMLLDTAWCRWLAEEDVLVGLSLDGPADLHDAYRVDKGGMGSFSRVEPAAGRLREAGVRVNAMVSVHAANMDVPHRVYSFLTGDLQIRHLQLIPIVERQGDGVSARSVHPAAWGQFLIALFDRWLETDVGTVFVSQFDAALASWAGLEPDMCVFRETCGGAVALEHRGDLYSCDHFVDPAHRLGTIHELPLKTLVASAQQQAFGHAKRDRLPSVCRRCPVLFACRGECPKNRFVPQPDGALNYLCAGYLAFFLHIDPAMRQMAELLQQNRPVPRIMDLRRAARDGLDRHAPCPCESGRKYRKCHGSGG